MIKNSFIFLDKVGIKLEINLWSLGVKNWQDFLNLSDVKGISKEKLEYHKRKLKDASIALLNSDYNYFIGKLVQKEMWRLYPEVKGDACFLDIEVDSYGGIILVGISDYYTTNFFVKGVNLDCFSKELEKYKAIITFNGGAFDLPKLKKMGVGLDLVHIDLKPLCVNLGLVGGLKKVERMLNLARPFHLYGNPVKLWQAFHASGDKEYLDLLIEYNREDVENLKLIMDYVYKGMCEKIYKQINSF